MSDLWKERVRLCRESGFSVSRWCREQGIPVSSMRYHLDEKRSRSKPKFVELKQESSGLQLRIGNAVLDLQADFDELTLKRFLSVLAKSC